MTICVKLTSGRTVLYIDEDTVNENIKSRGYSTDVALQDLDRSDLTRHIYEGGFKVWECSLDLCDLIETNSSLIAGKRVLELGCGAGIPGILCAVLGASSVVLQDFNECVVQCFSKDNAILNSVNPDVCSLIDGSWEDLPKKVEAKSFDLILTSETIYNEDDYGVLHDAIEFALSHAGICWLAAKFFYFGVGGSVPGFIQYVESRGVFVVSEKVAFNANVPRRILELSRK